MNPKTDMPQELARFLERVLNWTLPGCQLFYRDTDAAVDVERSYPVGAIVRAGFFVDVTAKAQRPARPVRYIIASAHCAKIYEAMDDADLTRWRLCTLHFNSYFKVMDVYVKGGVTQIFLLHIPCQAVPFFRAEVTFNFIRDAMPMDLVQAARASLDAKLRMDVLADTADPVLLDRMREPVGLADDGSPLPLDFMPVPDGIKALSDAVRSLADDADPLNYPEDSRPGTA